MQHAHNGDAVRNRLVENDISHHRKTSQSGSEFLPDTTQPGLPSQELKFLVKTINERIRLQLAVLGNVAPDVRDVVPSAWTKKNDRHL